MTNADKIRSMSDEELFVFLTRSMNVLDTCVICTHFCCGYGDNYNCDEGVREWLKSDSFQLIAVNFWLTTDKQKKQLLQNTQQLLKLNLNSIYPNHRKNPSFSYGE